MIGGRKGIAAKVRLLAVAVTVAFIVNNAVLLAFMAHSFAARDSVDRLRALVGDLHRIESSELRYRVTGDRAIADRGAEGLESVKRGLQALRADSEPGAFRLAVDRTGEALAEYRIRFRSYLSFSDQVTALRSGAEKRAVEGMAALALLEEQNGGLLNRAIVDSRGFLQDARLNEALFRSDSRAAHIDEAVSSAMRSKKIIEDGITSFDIFK